MSIKDAAKEERQKFHELQGFQKKAGYLWDYYRFHFLGTVLAIAFIWSMGTTIYNNIRYTEIFYCAVINNYMTEETSTALHDSFAEYYGLDPESELMSFDAGFTISDKPENYEVAYASVQKLGAMMASKGIDCMIGDEAIIGSYAIDDCFYDLEALLPSDVFEAISDSICYYEGTDGVERAYVLDLSNTPLKESASLFVDPPLLGVVINSEFPDVAVEFIKYAFGL